MMPSNEIWYQINDSGAFQVPNFEKIKNHFMSESGIKNDPRPAASAGSAPAATVLQNHY